MSKKELSPLESLNDLIDYLEDEHLGLSEEERVVERKQIIETALKESSELRTRNYELLKESEHFYNERNELKKVLKIIKEERLIIYNSIEDAIATIGYVHKLPQEKVDLLKEYFK